MPRFLFQDNGQRQFLDHIKSISKLNSDDLGFLCKVSGRTFRDWSRGKFNISEKALLTLSKKFLIPIPSNVKIIDDFWYVIKGSKKGAQKRMELYGPPGTPEGRRIGGMVSQLRRREDPEKYKLLGCNVKKEFKIVKPSVEFAEIAGIILGDGAITDNHLRISVSSLVDRPYAEFVLNLFNGVFQETPKIFKPRKCNVLHLTISGLGLVEELERWGFIRGNKVKHQVKFPEWIWENIEFQKACVRGLMDTDGGCYFHKHKTNGLLYRNFGMSFANKSLPLVMGMAKVLTYLGIKFSLARKNTQVYIYSLEEIKKYFYLIGSHNAKNNEKFNYYLNQKTHRIDG